MKLLNPKKTKKSVQQVRLSCHHGHALYPNNLEETRRIIRQHGEIEIFEIDFISVDDQFISSHDYTEEGVQNGSSLAEWVAYLVVQERRTLFIDVKARLSFSTVILCGAKFQSFLFFRELARLRKCYRKQLDIGERIWIGCQDGDLREELMQVNESQKLSERWQFITDCPRTYSYLAQMLLPQWLSNWFMQTYYGNYDYSADDLVALDRSFFASNAELEEFIERSKIRHDATLMLYSYVRSEQVPQTEHCRLIIQYDYLK